MTTKGLHTYREIMQQPEMWLQEYESLCAHRQQIADFLARHLNADTRIIFTGAGTSAYIGDILEAGAASTPFRGARAIPTTDLVTNPELWLSPEQDTLLISFARSGESPESLASIRLADEICGKRLTHIFITCNAEGQLARMAPSYPDCLLLLLPPETDDKSLAMSSSFSTMLLTGLLLADFDNILRHHAHVERLMTDTIASMALSLEPIREIAGRNFKRAIFLGSGPLKGVAEESRLKLQELTDGEVMCCFDSFLGFRHGPKAVIKKDALLVYLIADDPEVRRYEEDLIRQIDANNRVTAVVSVSSRPFVLKGIKNDLNVVLNGGASRHGILSCVPYVFTAQLLGYFKSLTMGLDPDSPSVSGNISRVVEGVRIYPRPKSPADHTPDTL